MEFGFQVFAFPFFLRLLEGASSSSSSSIGVQEMLPIPPTVIRPELGFEFAVGGHGFEFCVSVAG